MELQQISNPQIFKTKEWFGEWFDSPYYHVLYKHRDDNEARMELAEILEKGEDWNGAIREYEDLLKRTDKEERLLMKGFRFKGIFRL